MALITIPNTFSAGAVIVASQHNSNFSTISTDYNGNIDNTNIAPAASIAYSKLNLSSSIVNADINASAAIVASKLVLTSPGAIGSVAPNTGAFTTLKVGTTNQGDVLYDNGTSLIRLPPGTSGQFLKTQGAAANPIWATVPSLSNLVFHYQASIDSATGATGTGEGTNASLTANITTTFRFIQGTENTSGATLLSGKYIKLAGTNTLTIYAQLWMRTSISDKPRLHVDVGGLNVNIDGSATNTTPAWANGTIDISSLTTSNVYDIAISLYKDANGATGNPHCGSIFIFGS